MIWRKRIISRIAIDPARPAPHRALLAICLIVKNEAGHIAEWAKFHRAVGVGHFIVYDNGCDDGTIEILRDTLEGDRLSVVPWDQKIFADQRNGREVHNQVLAYAHCLRNYGPRFRWLAFIDVDEFLVPVDGVSLPNALSDMAEYAQVSLPWHMFGRGGNDRAPDGGVLRNYLQRSDPQEADHSLNWKCIVDPSKVTAVRVHGFSINGLDAGVNDVGTAALHKDRKGAAFYSRARIQLNHYYTRSGEELRAKMARGSNKSVAQEKHIKRVMRIVDEIERGTVEDRLAADLAEKLDL